MALDVSDLVDQYRQRFDVFSNKVRTTIKLVPHTSDELKATTVSLQPVVKKRMQRAFDDLKVQVTDASPLVEEENIKVLTDVYMWSAMCLFCSQMVMVLAGSGPVSALFSYFFTPLGCSLIVALAIPGATLSMMKSFADEEQRRTIAFVATATSAVLIGCQLNSAVLRYWAPPTFVLPLCMSAMLPFAKHPFASQSRFRQFLLCSVPAVVVHLSFAYTQKVLTDESYLTWVMCSIVIGFVDFQMKVASLRVRGEFSVAIQQYLTCFLFLAFHFALSYAYGSTPSDKILPSTAYMAMKTK